MFFKILFLLTFLGPFSSHVHGTVNTSIGHLLAKTISMLNTMNKINFILQISMKNFVKKFYQ